MNDKTPIFHSLAMIEERIQEKLTVEMLAGEIHFSKYHYQRMFQKVAGDSVMAYVTRRRLTLAAAELAATDRSVLEIALSYGYDSHEGFTRSFKAYMGITPTEYRKYHLSTSFPERRKENSNMLQTKPTNQKTISNERTMQKEMIIPDDVIRALNSLVVEAGETAADTRKQAKKLKEGNAYGQFWEYAAHKTEKTAAQISAVLKRVASIPRQADQISACFDIIKAMEDAAYEASILSFQTGLTIARAMPEHQKAFRPLCDRYDALARHARIKTEKIVEIFKNLSASIFQDMRLGAHQKLQACAETGKAAAEKLSDPLLPYSYIAEELGEITETLSTIPLEEVTVCLLDEMLLRLDTIVFAAEADIWREPSHKPLFDGISSFKACLEEAEFFFRNLPEDTPQALEESESSTILIQTLEKMYRDLALQEGTLLFYLKGEVQKLGSRHLNEEQMRAFETICGKMKRAVDLAGHWTGETEAGEIKRLFQEVCQGLLKEADELGTYGGAIHYLAAEAQQPLKYLSDC